MNRREIETALVWAVGSTAALRAVEPLVANVVPFVGQYKELGSLALILAARLQPDASARAGLMVAGVLSLADNLAVRFFDVDLI